MGLLRKKAGTANQFLTSHWLTLINTENQKELYITLGFPASTLRSTPSLMMQIEGISETFVLSSTLALPIAKI
jgi:hypothetical protein